MALPNPLLGLPSMRDDLDRVEARLRGAVRSDDEFLTEIAAHLILAGGKRVRPTFALAAAIAHADGTSPASDEAIDGAVAVELVHLGSLYHDDVMDGAATRRTVESVNARWGNLKAILAGDFLLARASEIAAGLGTEVAGLLAATIGRLCEGQVRELQAAYQPGRTEAAYLASIEGKTASLLASACRIGAIVGGQDRARIEHLTEFGRSYGMAFQIVDDVLDVVATAEQIGKPAGNDLVEGTYTLPVIHALTTDGGGQLREMLGLPLSAEEVAAATTLIRGSGGVETALATARAYATGATGALASCGRSPVLDALGEAASHLLASVEALAA